MRSPHRMLRLTMFALVTAIVSVIGVDGWSQPAEIRLRLNFTGGLAYVANERDGVFEAGTARTSAPAHHLWIEVNPGATVQSTTLTKAPGTNSYALNGEHVRVSAGGLVQTGLPTLPGSTAVKTVPTDWNNLFFIPDLAVLAKAATGTTYKLKESPAQLLTGRVIVAGGALKVTAPSERQVNEATWEFRSSAAPRHNLSTGPITNSIVYEATVTRGPITLVSTTSGKPVMTIVPSADAPQVSAEIRGRVVDPNLAGGEIAQGKPVPHFEHLYEVLSPAVASKDRAIPYLVSVVKPDKDKGAIVGELCAAFWVRIPKP
jgi:PKD repeat protein